MAKSFWEVNERAKRLSAEIFDQIKRGVASWQKPWKPGKQPSPENFSTGSIRLRNRAERDGHPLAPRPLSLVVDEAQPRPIPATAAGTTTLPSGLWLCRWKAEPVKDPEPDPETEATHG